MAAFRTDRAVLNFYAGPTALPAPVVERMRGDILDFHGTRLGVMEISHRAPEIEGLIADTAARARRLLLDASAFYRPLAEPGSRSVTNVTFALPSQRLHRRFLETAEKAGLVGLAGHRSLGGCRASLFNGVTEDAVGRLADFMDDFARRNQQEAFSG